MMMTENFSRPKRRGGLLIYIALLTGLLMVTACDGIANLTVADHLERARGFQLSGDLSASIIELKVALQKDPSSAAARYLLGTIYVNVGVGPTGEKELLRAIELGMDRQTANLPLGRALLIQGKYQQLIDDLTFENGDTAPYKASILALHGEAYRGLRQPKESEISYRAILAIDPNSFQAYVGLARLAQDANNLDEAEAHMEQALEIAPGNIQVIALQADLAFRRGDYEKSETLYSGLLSANPNQHVARMGLALAQIGTQKIDQAKANLDVLLKLAPNHAYTNFLRALAAYQSGDYAETKNYGEIVFRSESSHLPTLLLVGASSYALAEYEQADSLLSRFLSRVPGHAPARKILGLTQLQMDQAAEAFETLEPLAQLDPENADVLTLVGTAAVRSGDIASAGRYFEGASAASPDNAAKRAQLGVFRVALGDTEQGLADYEQAMEMDPELESVKGTYGDILLRAKEYDKAIVEARKLQRDAPDDPVGFTLEGRALSGQGNEAEARSTLEKALDIRPGDFVAADNLASLDLKARNISAARSRYEEVLAANPDHLIAMVRLAELEARGGNHSEVIRHLKRAFGLQPDSLPLGIFLGRAYLQNREPEEALSVAQPMLQDHGDVTGLLEVVGMAQAFIGQTDAALASFTTLADLQPQSAQARFLVARTFFLARDFDSANASVDAALSIDPAHSNSRILRAQLLLIDGKPDQAAALAAEITEDVGDVPAIHDIEAAAAELMGDPQRALAALRQAQDSGPSTDRVVKLAAALWRSGDRGGSARVLQEWVGKNPVDRAARTELANYYMALDDYATAREQLELLLDSEPGSWVTHNNLAWALLQLDDPAEARDHAQAAYDAQPENAGVSDTFGAILLELGEARQAERMFRQSVRASPDAKGSFYRLALALSRQGDTDEAREILGQLLGDGASFTERNDAQALLDDLNK